MVNTDITVKIVTLRILIGFLGEKSQYNWWDTNFLSKTGRQFLAINFPRSTFAAGCNSVSEAAKRIHDKRIGKGSVYHLFRFSTSIENLIHKCLISTDYGELFSHLKDKDTVLKELQKFISSTITAPEGPVQIGTSKNMLSDFAIDELARHYHDAFSRGKQCFPYFKS